MATIGVLVPASPGHLNPMTSLGRELTRRGHRVVVTNLADAEAAVVASGLEFRPIGAGEYPLGSLQEIHETLGKLQGWAALKYTLDVMTRFGDLALREAPGVLRSVGPDLLLVDQAAPGGSAVADYLGMPYVTVANALMFNVERGIPPASTPWFPARSPIGQARDLLAFFALSKAVRPLIRVINEHRQAWGLPIKTDVRDWFSPFAEVCQQPAEFEFPRKRLPPHFHFTGPFQDPEARSPVPFPFEALDGRPLIYASLGTLQNRLLWIFRAIAEATDGLGAQLVISLGGSADPEVLGKLPGNPLVVRAAPQLDLLERAALVITHAGMNTALESLARGVPMVAIPITNDQPGVAARIAWTGTGLSLPPKKLTVPKLRNAIKQVLGDPSFARRAASMKQSIINAGGAPGAADVVEELLRTGRPVLAEDFGRTIQDSAH